MAKDLKDILHDDKAFESALKQAMDNVGKEGDRKRIDAIREMSEDEFQAMIDNLGEDDGEESKSTKTFALRPMLFRAVAACAAIVLIIVGIGRYVVLDNSDASGYASLFNAYYKGNQVDWETFDAGDDRLNTAGTPSTAALLEHGTKMLAKNSKRSVRNGIAQLEHLLTLNYKRSLEHEIRWYLGLGYMKDGQTEKARHEFERVISLGSSHSADARDILRQL